MSALSAATAPTRFRPSLERELLLAVAGTKRTLDPFNERLKREISDRVVARRRELGWRREDVVALLEEHGVRISVGGYAKWERGELPGDRVTVLAEVLGVDPAWIQHGDQPAIADLAIAVRELTVLVHQFVAARSVPEPQSGSGRQGTRTAG